MKVTAFNRYSKNLFSLIRLFQKQKQLLQPDYRLLIVNTIVQNFPHLDVFRSLIVF